MTTFNDTANYLNNISNILDKKTGLYSIIDTYTENDLSSDPGTYMSQYVQNIISSIDQIPSQNIDDNFAVFLSRIRNLEKQLQIFYEKFKDSFEKRAMEADAILDEQMGMMWNTSKSVLFRIKHSYKGTKRMLRQFKFRIQY